MWQRFDESARKVILLAQEEAIRMNAGHVGVEHLLLGLSRQTEGVAAQILESNGVDFSRVQSEVERLVPSQAEMTVGEPKLTPLAKRTLELAADEASRMRHHCIGTEHLLLALLRIEDGPASTALRNLGLGSETTRAQILIQLGSEAVTIASELLTERMTAQPQDFDSECFDVFGEAINLAKAVGQGVRSEHLLLALMKHRPKLLSDTFDVKEPNSKAARVRLYVNLDLYEEAVRERDAEE